jgi:hypothetical protein
VYELRRDAEPHRAFQVVAHHPQQVRVAEFHRVRIERAADHHAQQRLARARAMLVDARLPQRAEDARPFAARDQEPEAVERTAVRGQRRRVVAEDTPRRSARSRSPTAAPPPPVKRIEEIRRFVRRPGEDEGVGLDALSFAVDTERARADGARTGCPDERYRSETTRRPVSRSGRATTPRRARGPPCRR